MIARLRVLLSDGQSATHIRALIRAAVVLGTAFGLQLSPDQIAAVYGFNEAALQAAVYTSRRV